MASRLVMKFGGTSVADLERIRRVGRLVAAEVAAGHKIAVVVYGEVIACDTPERVRANTAVQQTALLVDLMKQNTELTVTVKSLNPARPRVSRILRSTAWRSHSAAKTPVSQTASSITDHTDCPAANSELCST